MPYFSARLIKSAIESVFSVESLSGVPDERPSRKASFVFCMSVESVEDVLRVRGQQGAGRCDVQEDCWGMKKRKEKKKGKKKPDAGRLAEA